MKGIMMIEPLYHATVAGTKTQTRRSGGLDIVNENPDDWNAGLGYNLNNNWIRFIQISTHERVNLTPHYKVGEVLYLKEPVDISPDGSGLYYYYDLSPQHDYRDRKKFKWPNKLFMPESAARAYIRITGIKCERLLDICEEDCIAEGIETWTVNNIPFFRGWVDPSTTDAKSAFINLYKFANKAKEVPNLWVWVYSYELTFRNKSKPSRFSI